jgi:hypothetical protein
LPLIGDFFVIGSGGLASGVQPAGQAVEARQHWSEAGVTALCGRVVEQSRHIRAGDAKPLVLV